MIKVDNLSVSYSDKYVLNSITLEIPDGSWTCIVGPNGAGKTSLLETIAGLKTPYSGEIKFKGSKLASSDINYIGHKLAIKLELSAFDNLIHWARSLDGLEALPAAIVYLSLGDALEQKCKTLSSGMRKKLSLARLMLSSAPIWLLDEIQSNLDEHNLQLLQGLIASKISSGGIIIISTHIKPPKGQILNLEDFC